MIVLLKKKPGKDELTNLVEWLCSMGLDVHVSEGKERMLLGLIGDTSCVDIDLIRALDIVDNVKRIQEPFKNANRKLHPDDSRIDLGVTLIGGGTFQLIAGPYLIETEEQICTIAREVKQAGATMLRGGAFSPRTSPYAFQGLREEGIRLLLAAKRETGLPVVTELMDIAHLEYFDDVDVIQVGARNSQNYELLRELGRLRKPILLKRGSANTMQELLMSAEYIMAGGNENVILCECGIRTFEPYTQNTLDLSAVPALKELSHLPVIVDPSRAVGIARLVCPMALAAAAAGADGVMVEVLNDPQHALCEGPQSITPAEFAALARKVNSVRSALTC